MQEPQAVDLFGITAADRRLTTFPISRPALFKYYEDAYKSFWPVEDVSLSKDVIDYSTKLTMGEKHFVKHVLAFFAASDGIINLNLAKRFKEDVNILEAGYFYDFQIATENVHAHMYSLLLNEIIPSKQERDVLQNAIQTMPIIKKMSQYMFECIDSDAPFAERLLKMACVEGIFFTGCFCAIYWLQQRGLMPALGHSNELIARDEALHTMFAMFLYTMLKPEHQLSQEKIYSIFAEAVELASEFIREALPDGLIGMNADMMIDYIKSQADNLLTLIDLPALYEATHDFGFMTQQNLVNRTNFFERRVSEYARKESAALDAFEYATDF